MSESEVDRNIVSLLQSSVKLFGPIEPVTLNVKGELVDGKTRKASDAHWPEAVNQKLDTEEKCFLFRIHKDWFRTNKGLEWKTAQLIGLAKCGNTVKAIHEKTGIPEKTIRILLPSIYKDPVKAASGALGAEMREQNKEDMGLSGGNGQESALTSSANLTEKDQEEARKVKVECQGCHLKFPQNRIKGVQGKLYCIPCATAVTNELKKEEEKKKANAKPRTHRVREHFFVHIHYYPDKTSSAEIIKQVRAISGVCKVTIRLPTGEEKE